MKMSVEHHETVGSAMLAPFPTSAERQTTGERSSSAPCLKKAPQAATRNGFASPDDRPVPRKLSKQEAKQVRETGASILRVVHASQEIVAVKFEDYTSSRSGTCGKQSRSYGRTRWAWGVRQVRGRGTMSTVAEVSETEVA